MSTFDGYFREFDGIVRADRFDHTPDSTFHLLGLTRRPLIHLLSHAHSDHLVGLDSFTQGHVYCSAVTKGLVLKLSRCGMRMRKHVEKSLASTKGIRTYARLQGPEGESGDQRDHLRVIPVGTPFETKLDTPQRDPIRLTLIDANHCPGSVMFLVQLWGKSVLYTGDIRAEPWWVETLCKNPVLAPFLGRYRGRSHTGKGKQKATEDEDTSDVFLPLDNIYLDTSSFMCRAIMPSKTDGIDAIIAIMEAYPPDTIFFLNAWTWGYEELLERVALHFRTKIHVDPYKASIYRTESWKLSHPLLSRLCTSSTSPSVTRFHACERKYRCPPTWGSTGFGCYDYSSHEGCEHLVEQAARWEEQCRAEKRRVVSVNPWDMEKEAWDKYRTSTEEKLEAARASGYDGPPGEKDDPWPEWLVCPIARHSSFPELHHLVSIFRPRTLFPNTLYPNLDHLDYRLMPVLFADVLHSPASVTQLGQEARASEVRAKRGAAWAETPIDLEDDFLVPTDGQYSSELIDRLRNDHEVVASLKTKHLAAVPEFAGFMWDDNWVGAERTKRAAQAMMYSSSISTRTPQPGQRWGKASHSRKVLLAPELALDDERLQTAEERIEALEGGDLVHRTNKDFLGSTIAHPDTGQPIEITQELLVAAAKEEALLTKIVGQSQNSKDTPTRGQLTVAFKHLATLSKLGISYRHYSCGGTVTQDEVDNRREEVARTSDDHQHGYALERAFFTNPGHPTTSKAPSKSEASVPRAKTPIHPDELEILPGPPLIPMETRPPPRKKVKHGHAASSLSGLPGAGSNTLSPTRECPLPGPKTATRQLQASPISANASCTPPDDLVGPLQSTAAVGGPITAPMPASSVEHAPLRRKRRKRTLSTTFARLEELQQHREQAGRELLKCFSPALEVRIQGMSAADREVARRRVSARMRECTVLFAQCTTEAWRCERRARIALQVKISRGAERLLRSRDALNT